MTRAAAPASRPPSSSQTPFPSLPQGLVFVDVDGKHVIINTRKHNKVQCADDVLRGRVEKALARVSAAMQPCDVSGEV